MKFVRINIFLLSIFLLSNSLVYGQISDTTTSRHAVQKETRKEKKQREKRAETITPAQVLTDPAFIDFTKATIYLSPGNSLDEQACLRSNFTDQFVSVWQNPGRIYPASLIYGFSQDGKYYRACKFDPRNSVFGELIVKGKMNLYYCRKLPQEAGLIEFISMDPKNQGYRNFMIVKYEVRARYANDYYYFITLSGDSLNPIPVKDFAQFADEYLKKSPEAYKMMMPYGKKKTLIQKAIAPVIAGLVCVAAISAGSIESGILISSPFIVGGVVYYQLKKKKAPFHPDPDKMAEIIRLYNSAVQ